MSDSSMNDKPFGISISTSLLVIGTLVQLIGYITFFQGLLHDPLYVLVALVSGYLLIVALCVTRLRTVRETPSLIITSVKLDQGRKPWIKRNRGALALLTASTVLFTSFSTHVLVADASHPQAPPIDETIAFYQQRRSVFSLVDLYGVNWTGGGAFAITRGRQLPLAYIVNPADADDISLFVGTACALSFEVVPRERVPWVRIDSIIVVVNSFAALPQYEPMIPAPVQTRRVFYVEMDNPALSRVNRFAATAVFDQGQRTDFEFLRLERGRPENMVIRINARTPGIYRFSTYLKASYRDERELIPVALNRTFLFDGVYPN